MALAIGSRGPEVRHRQHQLRILSYYQGRLDGIFGSMTKQAVIRFQSDHGLATDGIIGPATAAALDHAVPHRMGTLKLGSRGDRVAMVQHKLHRLGFYHGKIDGIFGPMTAEAVKAFQASHGLTPDGIVGSMTMMALHNA